MTHNVSPTAASTAPSNSLTPTLVHGTFSDFNFEPRLTAAITAAGYKEPTAIQLQAIPAVMAGKDVLGLAQTGTGKTAAFALPIIHKLLTKGGTGVRCMVIVPTRELADQVAQSFRTLAGKAPLRVMTMYGGVPMFQQYKSLRSGVEVIVGCPGRIFDHIERKSMNLNAVETLVLDEADQMFDMGFVQTIRRIVKCLPAKRQNLLFSATMPDEIRDLTREILKAPVTVQVAPVSSPDTLTHIAYPVPHHLKTDLLLNLLKTTATESVLVFTRTKHTAKRLARNLERSGVLATSLQGNLSQSQRSMAMKGFRSGKYSVMVATDIASRGIDISTVSHVVNFDIPDTIEAYVHRTGRTGRASRTGDAITFVTSADESMVRAIERKLRVALKRARAEGFDYSARASAAVQSADSDRDEGERPRRNFRSQRRGPGGPQGGGGRSGGQGRFGGEGRGRSGGGSGGNRRSNYRGGGGGTQRSHSAGQGGGHTSRASGPSRSE